VEADEDGGAAVDAGSEGADGAGVAFLRDTAAELVTDREGAVTREMVGIVLIAILFFAIRPLWPASI
jgi:hypothetical protein